MRKMSRQKNQELQDSEMLKEAIKANTENQTKIMAAHDVLSPKTDEIFTNLTVYYADKKQEKKEQAKDLGRSELLQGYTKRTMDRKVEKYEDVFNDMKGENPKLLLIGKAGIGKTFLCEKVIRDWSMNRIFQNENTPNIQFAYLLKFRQLSKQGDKEINLQELLNCSPLLDDNSVIDDSLFEHLIQNPSKVLIILDGFDECSEQHRKQIASHYEERYANNPKKKMPIPALCSKLIRGKVLRNSAVLVSSRPGQAEELGKIKFGRYVEISGFSPEQVIEYVDKYFGGPGKEQTRNDDTIPSEILARGPEAQKAYEEALKSGKTKNRRLLIMVVGPARAGKTSLLKSLNGEEFDPKEDSTDGIQLQRTFCKSQENCWNKESDKGISYDDCMAHIIHKKFQGGDDSEEIHDKNFEKESIKKSVESSKSLSKNDDDDRDEDHDADDDADEDDEADDDDEANEELESQEYIGEKSTANLPKSIEEKLLKLMDTELSDKTNREKSTANLPKSIEEKLVKLMDSEVSDKTNRENEVYIKSLDFAGQAVYNVIHPIFLTSKAVFILVYNLKNIPHDLMKPIVKKDGAERELVDPFEMTNLENLELWLSCISSYTDTQRMAKIGELSLPPVFIAGTHADKVDGNLEDAKEIIREIYKSVSPSKNPSGFHVVRNQIYAVNNSVSGNGEINDKSVRKLKADIEELSKSLPHMNEDIPIKWLWFEEELSNLVEKENKKYITIDEALKIANEGKVNTSDESKEFLTLLNYLHDLKTVIYFEETKKVFMDTEWLVTVFTKVIEVRPVEKRDGFDKSWDKLEEKGVLDRALVEHVWKGLVDEQNTIDALLLIMEKFSLICRWNTSEGKEVYLVPCMLCNSKKREDIAKCLEHEKSSTMVIRFNISHVSLGIFPRLFVAIAEEGKKIWPNLRQPILHKNICRISKIGKERNLDICIIQSSFQTISVTVCNKQNIDGQRVTEFCQHFRKLLDQIFDEMRRNFPWMQNMKFEYGILCPVCTTSPNKCKSHEIEGCTRDTCLHFVNEEELSVDTPECEKDVANLDNVIEEKTYVYWFPRQVVGSTLDLTENQKRWLVISICLNIVLLPPLRKFLEPNILNHYTNLKASYNIHNQVHGGQLVSDKGRALNYRSINNNDTIKKVKDYDYEVTSAVDLAKLYLQPHMAKFTGFNDTCELSAVLGVLSSASVFSADIQDFSSKVRKDVRNEWGHCNFQTWNETKFADSFNLMHSLLKALKLSSDDENTVADQLREWENNCEEICMANTVPAELVKDIEDKVSQLSREFQLALHRNKEIVAQLSEDFKHLAISQQEVCRVLETLVTVQDAIRSLNQRMGLVEVDVEKVKEDMEKLREEVKRAHERIDCIQK